MYDTGEEQGRPFMVMELMRGRTLKEQVAGKSLPLRSVLALGEQIADALEAAHHQGITHRDIKPANIFVTEHGEAKLLDFGLAKRSAATAGAGGGGDDDRTVSRVEEVTSPGTTMGTVSYMSPEQARGEAVGPPGDLFALGVVLYEMATGVLPFRGQSATEIIDAILHRRLRRRADRCALRCCPSRTSARRKTGISPTASPTKCATRLRPSRSWPSSRAAACSGTRAAGRRRRPLRRS